jgi:hypothetical protein
VEAARGRAPAPGLEQRRERQLLHEQALSAGWRLAVDWPDLVGAPRSMDWLRSLRAAGDHRSCAGLLAQALPGRGDVADPGRLCDWLARADDIAATVPAAALAIDPGPAAGLTALLRDEALAGRARQALQQQQAPQGQARQAAEQAQQAVARAQQGADMLPGGPVEVGPLAMQRAPMVEQLPRRFGAIAARLLAQLLDMCHVAAALGRQAGSECPGRNAWPEGELCGTGCALTARGPVFHRVRLDLAGRVADWRAVAPTDWHFAAGGAAARQLAACSDESRARLAIAGFDPCAPWSLQLGSPQPAGTP